MDNVIDRTIYPLDAQKDEAYAKRRLGLGVTGLANAVELYGKPFATSTANRLTHRYLRHFATIVTRRRLTLPKEKGSFPLFDKESTWLQFCQNP